MQLTYRGVPYEFNAIPSKCMKPETIGKYRGIAYQKKLYAVDMVKKRIFALKYQGIDYITNVALRNHATTKDTQLKPAFDVFT